MKIKSFGFLAKLLTILAGIFMLASFSPSLDGRAVVVDEGVMPSGLFAKTVGYLPGDVISVSNASGSNSVELLVIGALDPSEGVAIMLTPEAAKEVGIEKNSNVIVKITKRNSQDERVYGNAVVSAAEEPASKKAEPVSKETEPVVVAPAPYQEEVFEEETPVVQSEPAAAPIAVEDFTENTEAEESVPVVAAEDDSVQDEYEEYQTYAEPIEKAPETAKATVAETAPVEEYKNETPSENAFEEEPEPVVAAEPEAEVVAKAVEPVPVVAPVSVSETVEENQSFDEVEDVDDTYEAIVLVPAGSNPPVAEVEKSDEGETSDFETVCAKITKEPVENNDDVINYYDDSEAAEKEYTKLIVPALSELKPHSFYVQVAIFSDGENIQYFVDKYGKNYPITIVPTSNGRANQILIGSLSVDEYAVVLERFKSYGFRDAFVRKIK